MTAINEKNRLIVKRWRQETKKHIVKAFGGKCCCCGYKKTNGALSLHHLDPKEKDFILSGLRAHKNNWIVIIGELRKCVLVCHNCHSEIHEGKTAVPSTSKRFNEQFAEFVEFRSKPTRKKQIVKMTPCLVCKTPKNYKRKYCSYICLHKSQEKVQWNQVDLVKELKTKSRVQLAKELGVSEATIRKRLG